MSRTIWQVKIERENNTAKSNPRENVLPEIFRKKVNGGNSLFIVVGW